SSTIATATTMDINESLEDFNEQPMFDAQDSDSQDETFSLPNSVQSTIDDSISEGTIAIPRLKRAASVKANDALTKKQKTRADRPKSNTENRSTTTTSTISKRKASKGKRKSDCYLKIR